MIHSLLDLLGSLSNALQITQIRLDELDLARPHHALNDILPLLPISPQDEHSPAFVDESSCTGQADARRPSRDDQVEAVEVGQLGRVPCRTGGVQLREDRLAELEGLPEGHPERE